MDILFLEDSSGRLSRRRQARDKAFERDIGGGESVGSALIEVEKGSNSTFIIHLRNHGG